MYRFWDDIIFPCFKALNIRSIIEVGSDNGFNTKNLLQYAKDCDGRVIVIDPLPKYNAAEWEEEYAPYLKIYKGLSLDVLPSLKGYDSILLDGDHNWYTVYHELQLIRQSSKNFPLVFLHDIGWPYARRDLYYNPEVIPADYRNPYNKGALNLNSSGLSKEGINSHLFNAETEGGARNGVLTAIEDFLNGNPDLIFYKLDCISGLGIITTTDKKEAVESVVNKPEILNKFLNKVEQERLKEFIGQEKAKKNYENAKKEIEIKTEKLEILKAKHEKHKNELLIFKENYAKHEKDLLMLKEKNTKMNKQVILVKDELSALEQENRNNLRTIRALQGEADRYKELAERHVNSFRYRVGSAIVESTESIKKLISLPLLLWNILKDYRAKGETITENSLNSNSVIEPPFSNVGYQIREYCYTDFEEQYLTAKKHKISIIIPIYNAYEDVQKCIKSVVDNTKFPYELVLIDDCSTDERIGQLLNDYKAYEQIRVYRNEKNLGFVGTVNFGVKSTDFDVVLLNSDTVVTPGWLKKLVIAAYHKNEIATATPFSNAAGAFSAPECGKNDEIPVSVSLYKMARIVERASTHYYTEVPTGNGFCLYIKRKAFELVGYFDEATFEKGYGEENDFCLRLIEKGMLNIIDDDNYIYHKRSASFGEEKEELIKRNRKIINERYPDYSDKIKIFHQSAELISTRNNIQNALNSPELKELCKTRILYVLHEGGGGTIQTNMDLMKFAEGYAYDIFILTSDCNKFYLYHLEQGIQILLKKWNLDNKWDIKNFYCSEYRNIYFDVVHSLHIQIVHIRHLFKHSFDIVKVCKDLQVPVVLSFHDFYFICPTIHLINSDRVYCNAECRKCDENCYIPSKLIQVPENVSNWVKTIWQPQVRNLLDSCSVFVTTSEYTKSVYQKVYPQIKSRFYVIEHGRNFDYTRIYRGQAPHNKKIKILLPGNIDLNKGSEFIAQLINIDKEKRLEFHCIGGITEYLRSKVIYHGKYRREDFVNYVESIKPSYVGIFSNWPETYCHVLTEAWSCGMPTIVSNIGTLKERAQNNGSILIDINNPQDAYEKIIKLSSDTQRYEMLCEQAENAPIKSFESMGYEYIKLYKQILSNLESKVVYVLKQAENSRDVPSTHVRINSPILKNDILNKNHLISTIGSLEEINCKPAIPCKQFLVIQRDKIEDSNIEKVYQLQKEIGLQVVFEIDDDLFSIQMDHPEYLIYKNVQDKIQKLSLISDQIITTSKIILKKLCCLNKTKVIPNYLDERLWLINNNNRSIYNYNKIKIIYTGGATHYNDLKLIKTCILKVKQIVAEKTNKQVELYVLGKMEGNWFKTVNVPNTEYPAFAKWITNEAFDIAIAPLDLNRNLNYGKSGLKYLEYSAMKLPGVYTDIEPYQAVVKNGCTGFLIKDNDENEWTKILVELCCNEALRKQISENAYQDLVENYLLKDHLQEWADLFE